MNFKKAAALNLVMTMREAPGRKLLKRLTASSQGIVST